MKLLFIHQNFPGQFKHLGPELVQHGHEIVALTPRATNAGQWQGISVIPYKIERRSTQGIHPWLVDFETKLIRGHACYDAAAKLRDQGYTPDVVIAHHGWGESLFLKDVWPNARMGLYCELYYRSGTPYAGFDPEFPSDSPDHEALRLRIKNLNNRLHEEIMDLGISPTTFQANTFPENMRARITVSHDGIDTDMVAPKPNAQLDVGGGRILTRNDEVITFINRNLEPFRGFHVFARALPELLEQRPDAQIVILGGDSTSYGARPPKGKTWKTIFLDEVREKVPPGAWKRVHFLGRVPYPQYLATIQVSSVHVYLTYPFVLSWSLLETMSVGCAVVASDTAPVREVLQDGETGILVDFFDHNAITEQVSALLDDPARRARLGESARHFVQAHYDLKRICLPRQLEWVDQLASVIPVRAPQD